MNIDQASQPGHNFQPRPLRPVACVSLLLVIASSACGNKGALYLEPDDQSLQQLEQAEQEINQAAQLPGSVNPAPNDPDSPDDEDKDSDDKDKENNSKKQPAG